MQYRVTCPKCGHKTLFAPIRIHHNNIKLYYFSRIHDMSCEECHTKIAYIGDNKVRPYKLSTKVECFEVVVRQTNGILYLAEVPCHDIH